MSQDIADMPGTSATTHARLAKWGPRLRTLLQGRFSWKFRLYTTALILTASFLLVSSFQHRSYPLHTWFTAVAFATFIALALFARIKTVGGQAYYNLAPAFTFAAAMVLPPTLIAPVILVGWLPWSIRGKSNLRFLEPAVNLSQYIISSYMAKQMYLLLGGSPLLARSPTGLGALIGGMITFAGAQTTVITGLVMVYRNVGVRAAETLKIRNVIIDLLVLSVGGIFAGAWQVSTWYALLTMAPIFGLYWTLRLAHDVSYLEEVDRLKTNIVANVSHELRAPLSTIKLYAQLLLENLDGTDLSRRKRFLTVIDEETDRLVELISALLDLSRIESGQFAMHKELLHPVEVIDEVVEALATFAERHAVQVYVDVAPNTPFILADRELMSILIKNLLSNAIKFSHPGGHVNIQVTWDDEEVLLSVQDYGIGIPQEAIPHLFQKFYRVQSTTESGIEGSGLGLVLAKEAAEAHDGVIEVISELGKGSCFTVRLPRKETTHES